MDGELKAILWFAGMGFVFLFGIIALAVISELNTNTCPEDMICIEQGE